MGPRVHKTQLIRLYGPASRFAYTRTRSHRDGSSFTQSFKLFPITCCMGSVKIQGAGPMILDSMSWKF